MSDLPVMLRVRGRRCLVVGGGRVALRRARGLADAGAVVTVVAPELDDALRRLPVTVEQRPFRPADLDDCLLVVVATDDGVTNDFVARQAESLRILVNRADDADESGCHFMASARHGPVTLAVHAGGISAGAAATIRRQLSDALDPDWPRLLAAAAPFRPLIRQALLAEDLRQNHLRRLTDDAAMGILKRQGVEALRAHLQTVADAAGVAPPSSNRD